MTKVSPIPPARPIIGEDEVEEVSRVLRTGFVAQGPETEAFEQEFSTALGRDVISIAVNSGTSALHIGMLSLGLDAGDEIIVPSFTFAATGNAVALAGAKPVFADIDPVTFTLSPESVESVITSRTRAIMPVHLYGLPADMHALTSIADRHDLFILEDAAQAHLASVGDQQVGTFGAFGAFSFYPTKNMTAGEGGMITTTSQSAARLMRLYRNQGMEERYRNEVIGLNNRMTDVHAAIGRVQLRKLPEWTIRRRAIAAVYDTALHNIVTPTVPDTHTHVYHQYTVRLPGATAQERDAFVDALKVEYGIGTGVYYPVPIHRLPSLTDLHDGRELPETEAAARECFSLPVYPSLTDSDIDRVITAVNALAGAR